MARRWWLLLVVGLLLLLGSGGMVWVTCAQRGAWGAAVFVWTTNIKVRVKVRSSEGTISRNIPLAVLCVTNQGSVPVRLQPATSPTWGNRPNLSVRRLPNRLESGA